MRQLLNTMKQMGSVNHPPGMRLGRVTSFDPSNYSVKVMLQPELALTGWLPLVSQWAGNGWGMFSPPTAGDGVHSGDFIVVQFHDGDFDNGVACQQFFNDQNRPLPVPSGEFWLVHKSGSFIKLLSDGSISSKGTWNHVGDLNLTGNEAVSGNVTAQGTVTAPNVVGTTNVTFGGKSGVGHTHSGVQTGVGNTGAPN